MTAAHKQSASLLRAAGREATRGAAATDPDRAERYATFIRANPDWPSIPLLRRRAQVRLWQEQRLCADSSATKRNSSLRLPSAKQEIRASKDSDERWRERRAVCSMDKDPLSIFARRPC